MKLELLVSQSGNLVTADQSKADSPFLKVRYLTGNLPDSNLSTSSLETLEISLRRDILRATQIQRKIDEPFLESCLAKWSHSLEKTEWGQFAAHLSILALIAPPLSKARELLVAIWGNASLLQIDDQLRWRAVVPNFSSQREAQSAFYRLRPARKELYLVLCPSPTSSKQLDHLPSKNLANMGQHPLLDYGNELQRALGAKHSWSLMRPLRLSRWSFGDFFQRVRSWMRGKTETGKSTLSRKKVTTIATGILLSMLCTFFLLTYTKQSKTIFTPSAQPTQLDQKKVPNDEDVRDEPSIDKRFQPYSAWIDWLQKPSYRKIARERAVNNATFLTDRQQNRSGFGDQSSKIKSSEPLSLQVLQEEIQRDLASLRRHRESLAQIAKSQDQDHKTRDKSPSLNWFEEEQKRSEQHLLMARSSLEKLSRRYGELSSLSTFAPQQPQPAFSSDLPDKSSTSSTEKASINPQLQNEQLQRSLPFASLTTLRQRLHFPLADWELPIVKRWIEQITRWGDSDDEKTSTLVKR